MTNHVTLRLDTWAASVRLLQHAAGAAGHGIKGLPKAQGKVITGSPCGQDPRTAHCALFQHKCTAPAAT